MKIGKLIELLNDRLGWFQREEKSFVSNDEAFAVKFSDLKLTRILKLSLDLFNYRGNVTEHIESGFNKKNTNEICIGTEYLELVVKLAKLFGNEGIRLKVANEHPICCSTDSFKMIIAPRVKTKEHDKK